MMIPIPPTMQLAVLLFVSLNRARCMASTLPKPRLVGDFGPETIQITGFTAPLCGIRTLFTKKVESRKMKMQASKDSDLKPPFQFCGRSIYTATPLGKLGHQKQKHSHVGPSKNYND